MIRNSFSILILLSIFLFGCSSLCAQTTKSYDNFYNDYLKANFLETKFIDIKSFSFEAFEESSLKNLIKGSDSIKFYMQKPYYTRTEYPLPNKRNYCFNGNELLKISAETNNKPQAIFLPANQAGQLATFSIFFNGFVHRNSMMSTNQIEKFSIVSDSVIIDNKRHYRLIQKLNDEFAFEYLIDYHSMLLLKETTIKNEEITKQVDYDDYRIVDGINFPFKIRTRESNNLIIERRILKFKLNPPLSKDFFNCL